MKRKAKIHWIIYFQPILLFGLGGFVYSQFPEYEIGAYLLLLGGVLILLNRFWYVISNSLTIDNSYVTLRKGVFSTVKDRVPIEKIENFRIFKSLLGNILNFGTIRYGNDSSYPVFKYVTNPDEFLIPPMDLSNQESYSDMNSTTPKSAVRTAIVKPSQNQFYENEESKLHKRKEEQIQVLNHTYIKKSDGTIEQPLEKLMWIGAPVGCKWTYGRFQGEPIKITWDVATKNYGKGSKVTWFQGCTQNMYKDEFNKEYGYQKGQEIVNFSNYSDWRLPTINELISLFNPFAEAQKKIYHLEEEKNMDGKEISYDDFNRLYDKIFPYFNYGCKIWSANFSDEAGSFTKMMKSFSDDKHLVNGWSYYPRSFNYNNNEGHWGEFIILVRNLY